jgi:hypothetical protein
LHNFRINGVTSAILTIRDDKVLLYKELYVQQQSEFDGRIYADSGITLTGGLTTNGWATITGLYAITTPYGTRNFRFNNGLFVQYS